MLDRLKKVFNTQQEDVMAEDNKQAEASVPYAEFSTLRESFVAQAEQLKTALSLVNDMKSKLTGYEQAAQAALEETKAVKAAARKKLVEENVGTEKAEAFLLATESLEDAAFESVIAAFTMAATKEAASPLFKEVGVDAQADPTKPVADKSLEMKLLEEKYKAKN